MTRTGQSTWRWIGVLGGLALFLGSDAVGVARPTSASRNREVEQRDSEARMKKDIFFLASEQCEGRGPTTKGINVAAEYVAAEFKKAGLKPGFKGSYFQPFSIAAGQAKVSLSGPDKQSVNLTQGKDFIALGRDQKGEVKAGLVFAGYGINCPSPKYNDYADLDVKGKIVVLLQNTPKTDPKQARRLQQAGSISAKLALAKKMGAVGVIVVNDNEAAGEDDRLLDFSYSRVSRGGDHVPAVLVHRSTVEKMLPGNKKLADIEKQINKSFEPVGFPLEDWTARIEVSLNKSAIAAKNIIGVLEGSGPLASQTVVVGAHYDHLGYGGASSLARNKKALIHFGADDNGSGTTAVIELARRFAAVPNRVGRRLVFMAFSGEEINLLGSAHYCENPVFPLKDTAAMYNLDMVGRAAQDPKTKFDRLLTQGYGTAKPFKEMIDSAAREYGFTLSSKASGFGPSDHSSFCGKNVPVLFVWTGDHPDYHRPTDTPDKINLSGMRRIVDMSEKIITQLTKMDKPAFVVVPNSGAGRMSSGPRLGIRPGYADEDGGLKVDMVLGGGAADRGGIKDGDVIVNIAGKPVKNIGTYMEALAGQKGGSTIEVVVERGGKKVTLKVKLD